MTDGPGRLGGERQWRYRFLDAHVDRVRYPDGSEGEQVLIYHPGAAAVVPLLSDPRGPDPQVLLIKQYRYATGGFLWEIPAGRLEPNEDPRDCAARGASTPSRDSPLASLRCRSRSRLASRAAPGQRQASSRRSSRALWLRSLAGHTSRYQAQRARWSWCSPP